MSLFTIFRRRVLPQTHTFCPIITCGCPITLKPACDPPVFRISTVFIATNATSCIGPCAPHASQKSVSIKNWSPRGISPMYFLMLLLASPKIPSFPPGPAQQRSFLNVIGASGLHPCPLGMGRAMTIPSIPRLRSTSSQSSFALVLNISSRDDCKKSVQSCLNMRCMTAGKCEVVCTW